ncbi:hypothetical protein NM688_g4842 [Phlebia brevispora]|uniref:Uncharacterized protein n=1 Tax=Phlebia brevispora TaxID=194682 RepID=A0ACC1T212_9APHY|nr:hypothetical protein NM688_g4842 [Phlebia brevispora]
MTINLCWDTDGRSFSSQESHLGLLSKSDHLIWPEGYVAAVSKVLYEANIPNVIWGDYLNALWGSPMLALSLGYIVPPNKLDKAIAAIVEAGMSPCPCRSPLHCADDEGTTSLPVHFVIPIPLATGLIYLCPSDMFLDLIPLTSSHLNPANLQLLDLRMSLPAAPTSQEAMDGFHPVKAMTGHSLKKVLLLLSVFSPPTRRGFIFTHEDFLINLWHGDPGCGDLGSRSLEALWTSTYQEMGSHSLEDIQRLKDAALESSFDSSIPCVFAAYRVLNFMTSVLSSLLSIRRLSPQRYIDVICHDLGEQHLPSMLLCGKSDTAVCIFSGNPLWLVSLSRSMRATTGSLVWTDHVRMYEDRCMRMCNAVNNALTHTQILLETAKEFSVWVQAHAPGAVVMLCGGLAFSQYGSPRATTDVDLCMDLRRAVHVNTVRRVDTNALKDIASRDPRLIVGPKIYWRHSTTGTPIQVDFVDANLFWAPFDVVQMLDRNMPVPSLNLPTLLVGKMKSAIERNQGTTVERTAKQRNDVSDFDFAVCHCLSRRIPLTTHHMSHLGPTQESALATVREFSRLRRYVLGPLGLDRLGGAWLTNWGALITFSQLPADFVTVANNPA